MKRKLPVDYIIVSVLANSSAEVNVIPTNKPALHRIFYAWRDKYSVLRDVPFEKTYFPYSEIIAQAFDNIEMSGLISKVNPSFRDFTLNREGLKRFYEKEIKAELDKKQVNEVMAMGKQLSALI